VQQRFEVPPVGREWLVRSTALNFAAAGVPGVVAIVAIPIAIHGLGTERYGMLSLAMVALNYLSLLDVGLNRGATRRVSEVLAGGSLSGIAPILWTAVLVQTSFAIAGALALALAARYIVGSAFHVPPQLEEEARTLFLWIAASLVPYLIASVLRGALEATRRFDLVNLVRVPSTVLMLSAPAVAAMSQGDLSDVGLLFFLTQLLTAAGYSAVIFGLIPGALVEPRVVKREAESLLRFAGWATVVTGLTLLLASTDRLVLGLILPLNVLPYYTAPFDALLRLQVIPSTIVTTLFPVLSVAKGAFSDSARIAYLAGLRMMALAMGLICAGLLFFSEPVLQFWLGQDFPSRSLATFQLLAIAVLVNSLAWFPSGLLMSANRPDTVAKLFVIDLVLFIPLVWGLITAAGIEGAAIAILVRSGVELALFFGLSPRALAHKPAFHDWRTLRQLAAFGLALVVTGGGLRLIGADAAPAVVRVVLLGGLAWLGWRILLSVEERGHLANALVNARHIW
jgi:O-antigen/teichoic acid export membrane protein